MKRYQGLAHRYLKEKKKQTFFSMLGIILAVALITATGLIGLSIQETHIEQARTLNGDQHVQYQNVSQKDIQILRSHIRVDKVGISLYVGTHELEENKLPLLLIGMDQAKRELLNTSLLEGRYPEGEKELVLENWIIKEMGLEPKVGQEIELTYSRYDREEDGSYRYFTGQTRFTLVGILADTPMKATSRSLGLMSVDTAENLLPKNLVRYIASTLMKETYPIRDTIHQIRVNLGLSVKDLLINENLLIALGEREKVNWPLVILSIIIVIATIAVIYNILHISVLERMRQFGLLRSIGSTPGQIRRIVFGEALLLSLIGIPIGLIVGILLAFGSSIVPIFQNGPGHFVLSFRLLAVATLVGLAAIFASTFNPARLAGKIPPLVAIKPNTRVLKENRGKKRRFTFLFNKLFGIVGQMAYQNIWRNKKRLLITVFSISLGVILFIVFSYYAANLDSSSRLNHMIGGDFELRAKERVAGYSEKDLQMIKNIPGVAKVTTVQKYFGKILLGEEEMSPSLKEEFLFSEYRVEKDPETNKYPIPINYFGYSSEVLANSHDLLEAGDINLEEIANEPVVLLLDNMNGVTSEGPVKAGFQVGDKIELYFPYKDGFEYKYQKQTFVVGGIINEYPVPVNARSRVLRIVMHQNQFQKYLDKEVYQKIVVNLAPEANSEQVEKVLREVAKSVPQSTFISFADELVKIEKIKNQIVLLLSSLVAVISLIGIFNIINTISSNLIIRTQEFGILRAVGITMGQLKKMIRLEGAFYGLLSALWGSIVGVLLSWVLFSLMKNEMEYLTWLIPWKSIIVAWVVSILVGVGVSLPPLIRMSKSTIIDSIQTIE